MPARAFCGGLMAAYLLLLISTAQGRGLKASDWTADRDALFKLRAAVSETAGSRIPSWANAGAGYTENPCSPPWRHLTCKDGRVTSLIMSGTNVKGVLPDALKDMDKLEVLDLSNNRFYGSVPEAWAGPDAFSSLRVLNLDRNQLGPKLPRWDVAGAWPALSTLQLGNNIFVGPLPATWLSEKQSLKNLIILELQSNKMGYAVWGVGAKKRLPRTTSWCVRGAAAAGSWCPREDNPPVYMPKLAKLDIGNNFLRGAVPRKWGLMFPSLKEFILDRNMMYAVKPRAPGRLPPTWTEKPAFPNLNSMYLYPGNDYLCFKDDIPVNGDAKFIVYMQSGEVISVNNPWLCPEEIATLSISEEEELARQERGIWADRTPGGRVWAKNATRPF